MQAAQGPGQEAGRRASVALALLALSGPAAAQDCSLLRLPETLTQYARFWDTSLNRDERGRSRVPAYALATDRIEEGRHGDALPFLDRAASDRSAAALRSGVPGAAKGLARLIRACRAWLPSDQGPRPDGDLPLRRKPSASPRLFFD